MTAPTNNNEMAKNGTLNGYSNNNQHLQQPTVNTTKSSKASTFHTNIPALNWLDALEKDFDKAFVDLDLLLGDFDSEQDNVSFECRQKLIAISGVFAQFVHKTQSLYHRTCSIEVCCFFRFNFI